MENNDLEFKPLPGIPGQEEEQEPKRLPGEVVPAGFNERFVAYVIDAMPFVLLAGLTLKVAVKTGALPNTQGSDWLCKFAWIAVYIVYQAFFSSGGRATLGKYLLNIRVRDKDGGDLPFPRALVRGFSYFLSTATLNAGFLMALFTGNRRALHDFTAGSRVVSIKDRSELANGLVLAVSWGAMVILGGGWIRNTVLQVTPYEKRQIAAAHRTISKLAVLEHIYMKRNGRYTNELARLAAMTGNVNAVRAELYETLSPDSLVIATSGRKFIISAKAKNWRKTEVRVNSQQDSPTPQELFP